MKKVMRMMLGASLVLTMVSCGSSKKTTEQPVQTTRVNEKVITTTKAQSGIEMLDALSEDGTKIVKVPYKWYSATGTADIEQVALQLAQQEAYATISRVFNNIVSDEAERGNVVNNSKVQQAITQHWEQMSLSILKGCEPIGDATVEYNTEDGLYTVTAKVGMTGARFNDLLKNSQNVEPEGLNEEEMQEFIQINKSIMEAARKQ